MNIIGFLFDLIFQFTFLLVFMMFFLVIGAFVAKVIIHLKSDRFHNNFIEANFKKMGLDGYNFFEKNEDTLNALSLPMKDIIFTSGLSKSAKDEELLAIALHEVGHLKDLHNLKGLGIISFYFALTLFPWLYFDVQLRYETWYISTLPSLIPPMLKTLLLQFSYYFLLLIYLIIIWRAIIRPIFSQSICKEYHKFEFQADDFSKTRYKGEVLAKTLNRISKADEKIKASSTQFKILKDFQDFLFKCSLHPSDEERIARLDQ